MKYCLFAFLFLASFSIQAQENEEARSESETQEEQPSVSYSLGVLFGANFQGQLDSDELDYDEIAEGMKDAISDQTELSPQEAMAIFEAFMKPKMEAKLQAEKTEADERESAYFEEVAAKKGIQETESGIYYEVVKEGSGESPSLNSKVTVHYIGTLPNGDVFDSSVQRGEPATFPVNGVIPGWQEIVPMMQVGGKWRVHIPYALAYGERGAGDQIPAYSTLVFEIELIDIVE